MTPSEIDPLVAQAQDRAPSLYEPKSKFIDHFSLEAPSDTIRFRKTAVRVYSNGTEQFQIVEQDDENQQSSFYKTKVTSDGSSGLSLIRAAYTLVTALMLGFLLIFCLQVLLFLFVSLVVEGGLSSKQRLNVLHLLGTILSVPIFVYGLASLLTVATEFVLDTWQGHTFFRSVLRWNAVFIDWVAFALFLGIPLLVMLHLMFTSDNWWETTALVWVVCVTISFGLFCLAIFIFEVWGALELLSHHPKYGLRGASLRNVGKFLKRAILIRQEHRYAGVRHRTFFIEGSQELPNPNDSYDASELADHEHMQERMSWYSKLTQKVQQDEWIIDYQKPRQDNVEDVHKKPLPRQYNVEDVLDRTIFVTDASWNLEKLFCRRKAARAVVVVNGPSRITTGQVISSMACAILGILLLFTFLAAFLRWMGLPILAIIVVMALVLVLNRDAIRRIYVVYDTYRDTREAAAADNVNTGSRAIYQVTETHRLTAPTEKLCWITFGVEIGFLFIFPLWMLFNIGNNAIALLFLILGLFSSCRHYFSVPVVLSELGSLDLLDGDFIRERSDVTETDIDDDEEDWREKNRLSKIVARISQGARRDAWIKVITTFVAIFMLLFLYAFAGGSNSGGTSDTSNLLTDFRYVPDDATFKYPTCSMTADFSIPGSNSTAMSDYAYIAGIAYTSPESMPALLDTWFGEGVAHDDVKTVEEFKKKQTTDSAVHYKLITFPSNLDFAVVAIRGTNNGWDMLSDAQLWSASALAQYVRNILPLGEMWNPILEELVQMIGVLQNESLKKVAFYVETSAFVNWLRSQDLYPSLRVTGHSLGGGLAMITGAQTHTPAIGLSGPNTIITRKTLDPPVSVDELDKYTFNIKPDRDPVPMIDDTAKNIQKINCLAPSNNFVDCHTATRSLCEIQYTCGSGSRPTLCDCALFYGYPEPKATGTRTFAEACASFM